jgi:hypothetical protein
MVKVRIDSIHLVIVKIDDLDTNGLIFQRLSSIHLP